jgi:hypothetical protein
VSLTATRAAAVAQGLELGVAFRFEVASSCAEGLGEYAPASVGPVADKEPPKYALVIARAPPAPKDPPALLGVSPDGVMELSWGACASDPNAPIEGYEVHKR